MIEIKRTQGPEFSNVQEEKVDRAYAVVTDRPPLLYKIISPRCITKIHF